MKAHVFISVLAFHIVVIGGLYLLSACSSSSTNAPTASQTSPGGTSTGGSIYDSYAQPNRPVEDENLVVTEVSAPQQSTQLDPAFNTGSDAYNAPVANRGGERFTPRRPNDGGYAAQGTPELNPLINDNEVLMPLSGPSVVSPTVTYTVAKGDSLWKISRDYDVSLKDLLQANGLSENSTINVGQQLTIPTAGSGSPMVSSPTAAPISTTVSETYTVVRGDTLSKIAKSFNTTVNDIKSANGLRSDVIQLNQKLTIPVNSVSTGNTGVSSQPTSTPTYTAPSTPAPSDQFDGIVHEVQPGETPSAIARKYGITTSQLMRENSIADARKIRPGQKLRISLGVAQPASTPITPPATNQRTSQPAPTPTLFDDSLSLEDIPEVEVVPQI